MPTLENSDRITEFCESIFIMSIELYRSFVAFLVFWMRLIGIDSDDDRFLHLSTRDETCLGTHRKRNNKIREKRGEK